MSDMNGAQSLIRTLVDAGVEVCFANPGTSEMHFVAALDTVPEMRGVLALFEGVVTGAADGYARIAGKPAATLLHLGPGLGNGLANLHNARRANTPIVNVVGDHATYHKQYDAPLESDIEAVAGSLEGWVRRSEHTKDVGADAAAAVAAAQDAPGRVATLILPADASWGEGGETCAPVPPRVPQAVDATTVKDVAAVFGTGESVALLIGGAACREEGLRAASRIGAATGAKVFVETFPSRLERGVGLPTIERLGYLAEQVTYQLDGVKHLIVAGTKAPVSFFAYPGKPSDLVPEGAQVHTLASVGQDVTRAERGRGPGRRGHRAGAAAGVPARAAERSADPAELGRRHRCAAPGERDHRRRGEHVRPAAADGYGRRAAARRADTHRRCDRLRHAGRDRRGSGGTGPSRPEPAIGR